MKNPRNGWNAIKSRPYLAFFLAGVLALGFFALFNSVGPAQATAAMIKINKVSPDGSHLLGATFRIEPNPYFCVLRHIGTGEFAAVPYIVTDNQDDNPDLPGNQVRLFKSATGFRDVDGDQDDDPGVIKINGVCEEDSTRGDIGEKVVSPTVYTITEVRPPAGFIADPESQSVTFEKIGETEELTFVNTRDGDAAGFLIIDEGSLDNNKVWWPCEILDPLDPTELPCAGSPTPNQDNGIEFSDVDLNEDEPAIGRRDQLLFFKNNPGLMIQLETGENGDEAWFAPQFIPSSWGSTGPTDDGLRNFLGLPVGPGLGTGEDPEALLDKIPDVTPLRATGLVGLEGGTFCALVYDSDVSINYDPLNGSLKGENLGIVAFDVKVDGVKKAEGFSTQTNPTVAITIRDADEVCQNVALHTAPKPPTSSEPFDVDPENLSGGYD